MSDKKPLPSLKVRSSLSRKSPVFTRCFLSFPIRYPYGGSPRDEWDSRHNPVQNSSIRVNLPPWGLPHVIAANLVFVALNPASWVGENTSVPCVVQNQAILSSWTAIRNGLITSQAASIGVCWSASARNKRDRPKKWQSKTIQRQNNLAMRERGIEPRPSAWEAEVLPLNYSRYGIPRGNGIISRYIRYRNKCPVIFWRVFGRYFILLRYGLGLQVKRVIGCFKR